MKRIAVWIFYAIGAVAIGYLALYAYVAFTGRNFEPGDPIHIFRKPDAPNYSAAGDFSSPSFRGAQRSGASPESILPIAVMDSGLALTRAPE